MLGSWRIKQFLARRRAALLLQEAKIAVERFPTSTEKRLSGLPGELIVNLTSYPPRYPTLAATIRSLLDQSMLADRTVLWLAARDMEALPDAVLALRDHGLEVRNCADMRSYKKLIPALLTWPDAYHVTADDDVYYPPRWLEGLVTTLDLDSPAIVAWRTHLAKADPDGQVLRYAAWEMATHLTRAPSPGTALFPTGVGGVLYPPRSLHPDVANDAEFSSLCPAGDDIWFYWMAHRKGTGHVRVKQMLDLVEWPSSQEIGLRVANVEGDGNDRQIRAMERVYGPFPF